LDAILAEIARLEKEIKLNARKYEKFEDNTIKAR